MVRAGQMTNSLMLQTFDFIIGYLGVLLGQCAIVSFFLFPLILLLRGTLFRNTVFLKGMSWGLLLVTPFLGKLKILYEEDCFRRWLDCWNVPCTGCWWARYGYLLGMAVCAGVLFSGRKRLRSLVKNMERRQICGWEVRVNALAATPFAVGLFCPDIVVPEVMQKELKREELETILFHERTHIRLGHLWFYLLWDLLQILLWPNVFFGICRKYFQQDLEDICDRITIQRSGQSAYAYGMLLLKSMQLLGNSASGAKRGREAAAFAGADGYERVRKRILKVAAFRAYTRFSASAAALIGAMVLAGIFLLAVHGSYPRYVEEHYLVVQENAEDFVVLLDSEEYADALSWDDSYVFIHREGMDRLLEKYGIEGERFWLGFGGYTKIPKMGSGGSCAEVDYRGEEENLRIPYHNSEKVFWIALVKQMP